MMHNGFQRMMSALWQEIGLGEPVWNNQGAALLHLEGQTVKLKLSENGRFVEASVDIAPLSLNSSNRQSEINALLKYNLLSLTANTCAVCFNERKGATLAMAKGLCPCEPGLIPRLSQVVVDLVYLRDECLRILAQKQKPEDQWSDGDAVVAEGSLIFTP